MAAHSDRGQWWIRHRSRVPEMLLLALWRGWPICWRVSPRWTKFFTRFSLLGACIETTSFDLAITPGASKRGD